ncbi:MAG: pyruvate kinase, partial [Planctomycetota bacterium]
MRPTCTKIVATVGPASGEPETIRAMVHAGVDVFRLNFSHGDYETHGRYIEAIRRAAADAEEPVAILQDLQGPRIRTGALRGHEPVELAEGAELVVRSGDFEGDAETIPVSYGALAQDVGPGDTIVLSDGLLELTVLEVADGDVRCRVALGGRLGENR